MDKTEALQLAEDVLKRYRTFKFDQLAQLVDSSEHLEVVGRSGVTYQVDVQVFWEGLHLGTRRLIRWRVALRRTKLLRDLMRIKVCFDAAWAARAEW
jgi:hypothetical protein